MANPNPDNYSAARIGVVADDLTGACDSGVEFLACSKSVFVMVESSFETLAEAEEGIIVYNTQSRNLPPKEAYDRSFEATRRAFSGGAGLVFKKVDSALRGNFAVEVGAVMDAAAAPVAFILPAIPDAGRETIGGVQHIHGIPVAESFYASDPEHPVTESSVLARAEQGSSRKAGLISLADVRAGRTAEAAMRLQNEGRQLIVVDARSPVDLDSAVKDIVQCARPKVFVGCQGLARALASQLPTVREAPLTLEKPRGTRGSTFFVCGTPHPQSKRQLEIGAKAGELQLVEVGMSRIGKTSKPEAALNEFVKTCRGGLLAGQNVAVCVRGKVARPPADLCDSILAFLSNLCRRVVEVTPPAALVLTGGETAHSVCRALGIGALKLHARILPLVVASKVVGGPCHGMIVVAKGGSIGPDDVVCRIHESLRGGK